MSKLYRNAAIGAGLVGAGIFLVPRGQKPMETYASQNVAKRMSAGGGTHTHTPGVATPRGKPDHTVSPQEKPKGIDTKHFQENHADQQAQDRSGPEKALNKAAYGQESGK